MNRPKRRLVLVLALVAVAFLGLSGCDVIAGLFNPLIGTWSVSETASGITLEMTFEFTGMKEFTWTTALTYQDETTEMVVSGTFTNDDDSITLDPSRITEDGVNVTSDYDLSSESIDYDLSSDKQTLTLTMNGTDIDLEKE